MPRKLSRRRLIGGFGVATGSLASGMLGAAASEVATMREVEGTITYWMGTGGVVTADTGEMVRLYRHQLPFGRRVEEGDRVRVQIDTPYYVARKAALSA